MAIRWRKKDTENLQRLVRNYNAKITRLAKKGYDTELLPDKLKFKDLKKRIETRQDFNTEVNVMKVFTARYSENVNKMERGALIPTFAMKQANIKIEAINRKRREQRKKIENMQVTDRNKKLGVKVKEYVDQGLEQMQDRHFNPKNMSKKDFAIFQKTLWEYNKTIQEKNSNYRDNLYKSFETVFKDTLGDEYVKELYDILDTLSTEDIINKYYTDINMNIQFSYNETDLEMRFDVIKDSWKEYAESKNRR